MEVNSGTPAIDYLFNQQGTQIMKKTRTSVIFSICLASFSIIISIIKIFDLFPIDTYFVFNASLLFTLGFLDLFLPVAFAAVSMFIFINKNNRRHFYFLVLLNFTLLLLIVYSFDLVMILFSGMEGLSKYYYNNLFAYFSLIIRNGGSIFLFYIGVAVRFFIIKPTPPWKAEKKVSAPAE